MPLLEVKNGFTVVPIRPRSDSAFTNSSYRDPEKQPKQRSYSIIPDDSYLGHERHDPLASWTPAQEKIVVRKTDLHLLLPFCILAIGISIDRHNLSNALTDGLLNDLGITTTDYNNGSMVSLLAILISEFPTQFLIVKYGYRNVFPWIVMAWGTVSWSQAFMTDKYGFYITRVLIGLLEGGFAPGTILFLTDFYKSNELTPRLAIFASMADLSLALASIIAAGVLKMRGIAARPGWFWLFLIEGILLFILGLMSYLYLPVSPSKTKSVLWPRSWYTPEEEIIAVNRVLRDDASKGAKGAHDLPKWKDVRRSWADSAFWGFYLVALLGPMPRAPVKHYLHLSLKRLGFSTFNSNMLAVPSAILQLVTVLGLSWSSQYFNERAWHCIFGEMFVLPMLVTLEVLPPSGRQWGRWTCATLIAGSPSYYPILISWISENSFDVKKRAVLLATNSVLTILGVLISVQIYQKSDEPYYYTGNKVTISVAVIAGTLFIGLKFYLKHLNNKKEPAWQAMSADEQVEYQDDKPEREKEGNRRLDFRFDT